MCSCLAPYPNCRVGRDCVSHGTCCYAHACTLRARRFVDAIQTRTRLQMPHRELQIFEQRTCRWFKKIARASCYFLQKVIYVFYFEKDVDSSRYSSLSVSCVKYLNTPNATSFVLCRTSTLWKIGMDNFVANLCGHAS